VIRRHYDVANGEQRLEERRRKYMDNLSLSNDE